MMHNLDGRMSRISRRLAAAKAKLETPEGDEDRNYRMAICCREPETLEMWTEWAEESCEFNQAVKDGAEDPVAVALRMNTVSKDVARLLGKIRDGQAARQDMPDPESMTLVEFELATYLKLL